MKFRAKRRETRFGTLTNSGGSIEAVIAPVEKARGKIAPFGRSEIGRESGGEQISRALFKTSSLESIHSFQRVDEKKERKGLRNGIN